MGFLGVILCKQAPDLGRSIEGVQEAEAIQLLVAEYVRKSSTVGDGTDLGLFLDQVVANETEITRGRGGLNVPLRIPIQPQDVSARYSSNPLLQVIQVIKVIEPE